METWSSPMLQAMLRSIQKDRNKDRLRCWIKYVTSIETPSHIFTDGNSCPLDFIADAFFNPGRNIAAWANRSGGKTLGASILAMLLYTVSDDLQGRVLSGSLDQARNLYHYWAAWCDGPLKWRLDGDVTRLATKISGGKLEILTASQKSVRGPKIQLLLEDELDEIDRELHEIAAGMIASRPERPARTIYTSTWHRANGTMANMVEKCPGNGVHLHGWNLWESIQRCPEDRHDRGRGCKSCPLAPTCVPKGKEYLRRTGRDRKGFLKAGAGIAAIANGLYAVQDVIQAAGVVSEAMFDAEYLCNRPSIEGLVYPTFDRRIHVKQGLDFDPNLPTYRAIDWGLNTFVCLWIQEDKNGNVYVVDELVAENATVADNARKIVAKDRPPFPAKQLRVEATFCDPAGRSRNDQTGKSDVDVAASIFGDKPRYKTDKWSVNVNNGIGLIRGALTPAIGHPRLFVAGACRMTIKAMESYINRKINGEYIDEPVKPQPFDHIPDSLRYYFVNCQRARSDTFTRPRMT